MINIEFYGERKDGVQLLRTYSAAGVMIQKVGSAEVYEEAIDSEGAGFEYEETDVPIVVSEDTETI